MALTQVASGLIASVAGSTITGSQSIPKSTLPTGSVLQVVGYVSQSGFSSTSSSSFVTTGYGVTITPTSSSSKILITVATNAYISAANTGSFTIYRGSTNLATGTAPTGLASQYNSAGGGTFPLSLTFLDSPATTSSTTYTVYYLTAAGTLYFGYPGGLLNSTVISIIAQEISA